jgi:cytoskeleton protein RodZ
MNEVTEQSEGSSEAVQPPMVSVGRLLAVARDQQGLSVADVARQLRLGVKQIEALEADDYISLPGNTFVRGFVRNYARLVQIDPEPLLQTLHQRAPDQALAVSTPPRGGEFSPYPSKRWMWYAGAVALMMVAAPLLVYLFLSGEAAPPAPARTVQAPPPPLPAAVPHTQAVPEPSLPLTPPPPEPAPVPPVELAPSQPASLPPAVKEPAAGSGRVLLKFDAEAWVEVRDKDGQKLFSQLGAAGSEQQIEGMPPFTLVVGNAAHVKVTYNGALVDLTPHINVNVARLTLQ